MNTKTFDVTLSNNTNETILNGISVNLLKEKKDKRVEDYVRGINQLYKDTGLRIKHTYLFDLDSQIVADILFDDDKDEYYARYRN